MVALAALHSPAQAASGPSPDEGATNSLENVIAELRADPSKACFLDGSRTPADHVGRAVREARLQAALADAQDASVKLSAAVRDEVVLQKEALLAEVDAVAALEKEVATVDAGVQSLASASGALAASLAGPYEPMTRAVVKLRNLHAASAALRIVSRFHVCTRKLSDAALFPTFSPSQRTSPEALPAAAEAVRELEEILSSRPHKVPSASEGATHFVERPVEIEKIDCIAKHIPAFRKAAVELRRRTGAMLKSGLAARDQSSMTAGIVSFHVLGVLPDRINGEVGRLLAETQSALQRGLEPVRVASAPGLPFSSAFGSGRNRSGASGASISMGDGLNGGTSVDSKDVASQTAGGVLNGRGGGTSTAGGQVSTAGSSLTGSGANSGGASESSWEMWSRIESMLDAVRDACFKAVILQQVLSKKYDDVTHVCLLHEPIASGFIDAVAKALGEQLGVLSRTHRQRAAAGQVFRILVAEYPRFRTALLTLSARVYSLVRPSPHPITSFEVLRAPQVNQLPIVPGRLFIENAFLSASSEIETHYLSASLERLTGAVACAFDSNRTAPGVAEALALARSFAAELAAARSDDELFSTSVSNVATALRIYASNAEDFATAHYPQAQRTEKGRSGPVVVREWPLFRMYNGLVTLTTAAKRVLGSDEEGAGPIAPQIQKEINNMSSLSDRLLEGLFKACTDRVSRALENMHTEDLSGHAGSDDGSSIYAVNVTAQLSMFAEGVVHLARTRSLGRCTVGLGRRILDLFVRNASLAFPLPDEARLRLTTDMARIELAVESLCPIRMLGESYLAIRAFRSLVFMTDDELACTPYSENILQALGALPPSVVAFHLFSRSKDAAFVHPHRLQDETPGDYCSWVDAHSDDEVWSSVERALEAYESSAASTPCVEYVALKSLAAPIRKRWSESRVGEEW